MWMRVPKRSRKILRINGFALSVSADALSPLPKGEALAVPRQASSLAGFCPFL